MTVQQPTGGGGRSNPLPVDDLLEVLARPRCREILEFLLDASDHEASFDACVEHVTRTGDDPRPVAIQLHHADLPLMAEEGLLVYDSRRKRIRLLEDQVPEAAIRHIIALTQELSDPGRSD